MRMRPLQSLAMGAILMFVLAPQTACTVIGAIIGSAADSGSQPRVIPAGEAVAIRRGRTLTFVQRDDQIVTGVYRDTVTLTAEQHAQAWQRWRDRQPYVTTVALGAPVTVVADSGEWSGHFAGYHYRSLLVTPLGATDPIRVPLLKVKALRGPDGYESRGPDLAALDATGAFPSAWGVRVWTESASRGIVSSPEHEVTMAWSDISQVQLPRSHSGALTGTLVGLGLDAILVVAVASSAQSNSNNGCAYLPLIWFGGFSSLEKEGAALGIMRTKFPYDRLAGREVRP